jgi:hypothetical protein
MHYGFGIACLGCQRIHQFPTQPPQEPKRGRSSVEDKYGLWIGCYASRPMSFMLSGSWEGAGGNGLDNERNGLLVGVRGPVDLLRKLVYWVHW